MVRGCRRVPTTAERVIEYPFISQNLDGVVGPILDMGCVHSRLPIVLASRGYPVVGVDFLPFPYRHPDLRSVRGDATRCPYAAGSFGAVLAISVIGHVGLGHYGDLAGSAGDRAAVREIARILRPGGRAIITVRFGRVMADGFKRVYDAQRLRELLAPLTVLGREYAWSRVGLWIPCTEAEFTSVDWNGPKRAVAMVVPTTRSR